MAGDEGALEEADAEPQAAPWWLPPVVSAALCPAFAVKVKAFDVFWHMATGRWMMEHGRLPTTDPFTYTMAGKPWLLVNGLADLAFYGAYRLGAEAGLVCFKILIAWTTLTLMGLCLRALDLSLSSTAVIALTATTALLVHGRYTMDRPMIIGASLLVLCQLAAIRSFKRRDQSHLLFLVALPLWPLIHGTALLGAAVLGSLLVSGLIARAPRRWLVSVAATAAACFVLSIATPWWRGLYHVATDVGGGATAMAITAEWEPALSALPKRVGSWMVIAGGIGGGILMVRRDASFLLLSLVGTAISARFARNAFEAVLLCMPAFALLLDAGSRRLRKAGSKLLGGALIPLAAAMVCAVQFALAPFSTIGRPFGFGLAPGLFPTDTVETLRRLPKGRLINDFPLGGYLIWVDGFWEVYIDGRTVALFGDDDVRRLFLPLQTSAEALTGASTAWNAPYALSQNKAMSSHFLMTSMDWVPLHLGEGTSLFIRRSEVGTLPAGVKALHLLRVSGDTEWTRSWYAGILKDKKLTLELSTEVVEAARLSPWSPLLTNAVIAVTEEDAAFGRELAAIVDEARAR